MVSKIRNSKVLEGGGRVLILSFESLRLHPDGIHTVNPEPKSYLAIIFPVQILFENKCKNRLAEISDRVETDKREVSVMFRSR